VVLSSEHGSLGAWSASSSLDSDLVVSSVDSDQLDGSSVLSELGLGGGAWHALLAGDDNLEVGSVALSDDSGKSDDSSLASADADSDSDGGDVSSDVVVSDGNVSDGVASVNVVSDGNVSDGVASVNVVSDGNVSDGVASVNVVSDGDVSDGVASVDGDVSDGLASVDGDVSDGVASWGWGASSSSSSSELSLTEVSDEVQEFHLSVG